MSTSGYNSQWVWFYFLVTRQYGRGSEISRCGLVLGVMSQLGRAWEWVGVVYLFMSRLGVLFNIFMRQNGFLPASVFLLASALIPGTSWYWSERQRSQWWQRVRHGGGWLGRWRGRWQWWGWPRKREGHALQTVLKTSHPILLTVV